MSSEYQELLEKLLNSDTTDVIPQSRAEYIMLTAINSLGIDTLPEPGSRMEAYLMALITKMSEGGSASQTQSDWNQNDSTAADYVKNRPFYTDDPVETEIFDVVALMDAGGYQWNIDVEGAKCGVDYGQNLFFDTPLVVGDKYKIQCDGANYECISVDGGDGIVILTDNIDGIDTGDFEIIVCCAPYVITDPSDTSGKWIIGFTSSRNTKTPPTELKVISQKTKIVKINPKYIDFPIETDPTVPAWAKEPTKPTYTAYEIQAQPDMYVSYFDQLINNLTAKNVVYISQAGGTSPIPFERYPVLVMRSAIDRGTASIVAYDSTGKTWSGSVNFSQGTIDLKERTLAASDIGAISAPATAEVGQTIVVKSVDGNGKPTEWEAVDMASATAVTPELLYSGTAENVTSFQQDIDFKGHRNLVIVVSGTKGDAAISMNEGNLYMDGNRFVFAYYSIFLSAKSESAPNGCVVYTIFRIGSDRCRVDFSGFADYSGPFWTYLQASSSTQSSAKTCYLKSSARTAYEKIDIGFSASVPAVSVEVYGF